VGSLGSLAIGRNGLDVMTMKNDGNVGIGTTSPSAKLHIDSTGDALKFTRASQETFLFEHGTSGLYTKLGTTLLTGWSQDHDFKIYDNTGSQYVVFDGSTQRLGIGTSSPSEKLEISDTQASGGVELLLTNIGDGGTSTTPYTAIRSRLNSIRNGGEIRFGRDSNYGSADNADSNIQFYTALNDTNTERMRIDSSGNVGIGCTPSYPLEVQSGGVGTVLRAGTSFISIDPTGSASAPSLIFNGDANTGIYRPTTDTLAISTAGSEAMRLDSSGNLGLGLTNPSDFDADANNLVVGSLSGNNGITIASGPNAGNYGSIYFADGTGTTAEKAGFIRYEQNTSEMTFGINAVEKLGIALDGTATFAGDVIAKEGLQASKFETDGNDLVLSANTTQTNVSPNIIFKSSVSGGSISERMRLDSSGRLGLGTSNPSYKLDIEQSAENKIRVLATGNTSSGLILQSKAGATVVGTSEIENSNVGNLLFKTGTTSASERMRITNTALIWKSNDIDLNNGTVLHRITNNDTNLLIRADYGNASANSTIQFHVDADEKARITSGGALCVGKTDTSTNNEGFSASTTGNTMTTATTAVLNMNRKDSDGEAIIFRRANTDVGSIDVTTTATSYNTSSDYRLKEDLQDFNALEIASKIKMYDFKWKADDSRSYGVMAHELEEVLPQAVSGEKDGEEMQSVDYSKLVPILLKSIQELKAEIDELKKNK
jgi:hypothetical protein